MLPIALSPARLHPEPRPASRAGVFRPGALHALLTLVLLGVGAAWPQARRCDLVGRDTVVSGVGFKRCLDLTALDGDTLIIPSNVTRIDNDGLSLCKSSVQSGGNADIVYVYDNSGSMRSTYAWINPSGTDTLYYENTYGCSSPWTDGTVNFTVYNASGTGSVTRTAYRLVSNTGCTSTSGDPYYARGRAMRLGIEYQAQRAPTSSAGIMSFTNSVANVRRPLVLNSAANISSIQSGINVVSDGGTNYRPPLDSSKRWLTTSITSNPRKAIIFLSDGRHNDGANYRAVLDSAFDRSRGFGGAMPPIYGIFLGRPIADTANLAELSSRTGGQFFLIPSNRPDSLIAVVERILDIVLREYEPTTATVSNARTGQSATSTAPGGFVTQTAGSWLMRLNNVIALGAEDANRITITTQFRERHSGNTENQTVSFLLMTTATPASGSGVITSTQFARTCYDRSSLRILNRAGADPPAFSEGDDAYQPVLRTSPIDLPSAAIGSSTRLEEDRESPTLSTRTAYPESTVFRSTLPFVVLNSNTNGNGTLEAATFDTMVVTWVHPRDSQDIASDTMPVRAGNRASEAWFSATSGGDRMTEYPAVTRTVYVVVRDQAATPGRTYTAVISSDRLGIDRETVTLAPLADGRLGGSLTVGVHATKAPGDNTLQVYAGGDQLRVVYRDPVYGDSAVGTAGFRESVQETPTLSFADQDGNQLDSTAVWSPSRGRLYVNYSDDYAAGKVPRKNVSLALVSRRYGASLDTDEERLTLEMRPQTSGTRATWTGSIELADAFPPTDSNNRAETRWRGEAVITAFGHDNTGAQQATTVSASLVIAYPDSQASITYTLADSSQVPSGSEGLIFTVRDQSFSVAANDSVAVSVFCSRSGDSVTAFIARENGTGSYRTGVLQKNEATPNPGDRVLSCNSADQIVARYTDPVFGTTAQLIVNEVARPVAAPPGRRFGIQEFVTLSTSTPGAVIHYTLDGSIPRPGSSPVYSGPIQVTHTTTLRAVATLEGWKNSKVMTETYTKEATASRLEILDENGNAPAGGYLTGSSTALRIKLTTTQANLPSVDANADVRISGDKETLTLANSSFLGSVLEYWQNVPLKHDSARTAGNDTLETRGTDTLIVVWRNPFDSSDVARDTVIVKPTFVSSEVYFSLTAGGPRITTYPVDQDSVFVVVKTRPRDPSLTYTVSVTSREISSDSEVLPLVELTPGVFSAKVPVGTGSKAAGDGTLQVAASGDQLSAEFQDPVFKDRYRGDAGFAQQVQETAVLQFIHADGRLVAPDEIWDPAAGKVYLRYADDWNAGIDSAVRTLKVRLELANKKNGSTLGTDLEEATVTFVSSAATRGTWEGSVPLRDRAIPASGNDTLETYFRGELSASIVPHNNGGIRGGGAVTDELVIAYPDQPAEIVIRDTAGTEVGRPTTRISVTVKDQPHTLDGAGAITVNVVCEGSNDRIQNLRLVWDGAAYVAVPPVAKGEGNSGSLNDSVLTCKTSDRITVTYTDPVYGDARAGEARWSDQKDARMYFASTRDSSTITSVVDGVDTDFLVIVEGVSPTRDKADTVVVILTTSQRPGDTLRVRTVETGLLTGRFVARAPFGFIPGKPNASNGELEAGINQEERSNRVVATGEAQLPDSKPTGDIALFAAYNMVVLAYMKDMDRNGRADRAIFAFDKRLDHLPDSLPEVAWNEEGEAFRKQAPRSRLSFAGPDSNVVVADFSADEFAQGLTGIPSGRRPYARFPADKLFGGQDQALADSVGPVPMEAVKFPSNMTSYYVTPTEKRFYPDTLKLRVSEELRTTTVWMSMVRFSKGCMGYEQSAPLRLHQEPIRSSSDPLEWTLIVDNSPAAQLPLVGDCIHLETDGHYTDLNGNRPGILGAVVTGENPRLVIRDFRGYPPVAGLDASKPSFVTGNSDRRDKSPSHWSTETSPGSWEVVWIPPAGFETGNPVGSVSKMVPAGLDPKTPLKQDIEVQSPQTMPTNISAVQVIATGRYIARISIYDNFGNIVRNMTQAFGFWGEEKNPWRATDKGLRSFLIWDLKDRNQQLVGQGVYVWKVHFTFLEKKSEIMYTRTGVLRP